jgi:hypothetical protein
MVTLRHLAKREGTPKVLADTLKAALSKNYAWPIGPGCYTDMVQYLMTAYVLGYILVIASKEPEDLCTWIQSTGKFERAFRGE